MVDIPELFMAAGTIPTATAEEYRRAQLSVAHHATDADECAQLLAMLGLDKPANASESAAAAQGVPEYRGDGAQPRRRAQRAVRAGSGRSAR